MDSKRLVAVLPCYALDDIGKQVDDETCREFHAAWTSLWHPSILALGTSLPEWKRSDHASLDLENAIIIFPESAADQIDVPMIERLELQKCNLVAATQDRREVLRMLGDKNGLDLSGTLPEVPIRYVEAQEPDRDLWGQSIEKVALEDFFALGTALLFVQGLTRKVHYSSNIDLVIMQDQVSQAARAYLAGDGAEANRWLQSCFDQLSQERDRYFNQPAHLVDLTLLAESTLGGSLDDQLRQAQPQNFLSTACLIEQLRQKNEAAWLQLKDRQQLNSASIVGGLNEERLHPWFPLGTLQRDLEHGAKSYQAVGVSPPRIFSRFGPGMTLDLPMHLKSCGFIGTILHAFSEGSYPVTSQAKISWEASDTTNIETISSAILDVASSKSVFNAINELAKQFDHHSIPTLVCAHWPSQSCQVFHDLVFATRRTSAFGEWTTLDKYFESTGFVYSHQTFTAADFKFPWPENYRDFAASANALRYRVRLNAAVEATRSFVVTLKQAALAASKHGAILETLDQALAKLDSLLAMCDGEVLDSSKLSDGQPTFGEVQAIRLSLAESLHSLLPFDSQPLAQEGLLAVNPYSGARRCFVRQAAGNYPKLDGNRIYESLTLAGKSDVIFDAPPTGIVQLQNSPGSPSSKRLGPNLASPGLLLANEFLECQVDPRSGYLRSIMISKKRGGRLSGMPNVVLSDASGRRAPTYATIRSASMEIIESNPLFGHIRSRGDIGDEKHSIANFQIDYRLSRGSRSLDIEFAMEFPEGRDHGTDSLWQGSPVWRTAWPSQAADLSTWYHGVKTKLRTATFFAPELIQIDDAEHKLYLAFQGLPIHRRIDASYLDSLLPSDHEDKVHCRWQIGLDWPRPYQMYLESLDEPWLIPDRKRKLSGNSLWFAQANQPNIRLEMRFAGNPARIQLHETNGREGRAKLSFFLDVKSAARVTVRGDVIEDLEVADGQVVIDTKPNEISFIDVHWV